MKKKPAKNKHKRAKTHSFLKIHPLFIILGFLLLLLLSFFLFFSNKPFCANSVSCIKDLSGNYDPSGTIGVFEGKKVSPPKELAEGKNPKVVLGENTSDKHIYVDLTHQRLYATEGNTTVYNFPISSGKWHKTPTGDFKIWVKLRYTRMEGGNPGTGTYYNLPNVPYTMFFYNNDVSKIDGYSIHGAYWHDNFGHPMSHGCINMKIADAKLLYEWTNPPATGYTTYVDDSEGTPITISGVTPEE